MTVMKVKVMQATKKGARRECGARNQPVTGNDVDSPPDILKKKVAGMRKMVDLFTLARMELFITEKRGGRLITYSLHVWRFLIASKPSCDCSSRQISCLHFPTKNMMVMRI